MKFRSVIAFAVLLSFGVASAQYTIPANKAAQLRKMGMKLLYPTYIPKGFRLKSVDIDKSRSMLEASAALTFYKPGTKQNVMIQFASEGLGDIIMPDGGSDNPPPSTMMKYRNSIFGSGELERAKGQGYDETAMQWEQLPTKGYPRYVSVIAEYMSLAEVKKIVESLRYRK